MPLHKLHKQSTFTVKMFAIERQITHLHLGKKQLKSFNTKAIHTITNTVKNLKFSSKYIPLEKRTSEATEEIKE